MRNPWKRLALACFLVCLTGCMTFEVEGGGTKSTRSHHGSETVHGSFYGYKWTAYQIQKCDDDHAIFRVEYHTNVLFALASVVSIGLYVPQTVEWWCQPPAEPETEEFLTEEDLLGEGDG